MEFVIVVLVLAGLVGGTVWNKRNSAEAVEGVEFAVAAAPDVVTVAVRNAYCTGGRAAAKSLFSGLTVSGVDRSSFRIDSRLGDRASIEVRSDGAAGSTVRARTVELYVGSPPAAQFHKGLLAITSAMTHGMFKAIGICPGAARMKKFQRGLEGRLGRELQRSVRG